jgi:hypothetical protein
MVLRKLDFLRTFKRQSFLFGVKIYRGREPVRKEFPYIANYKVKFGIGIMHG